jgi:outer membrane receptor protein involved in Fe transport
MSKTRSLLRGLFLFLLIALLFLPARVSAQLTRGYVSGTVSDPTGAVVVGVHVVLKNRDTNLQQETTSNEVGVYRFVAVEPGFYSLEYTAQGFERLKVENVQVGTSKEVVLNQSLNLGAETIVVEVVETTAGVELAKGTATIDRKLDGDFVQNVAITAADRDVTRLALLAPTVNRAPGSNEFSANGQRARNNNFLLDGTDNNDLTVTLDNNRIIPEGVAEFQVQTTAYSAEYGRNSGAQVSVITKSGTNQFHGEAWDYYRGNWMEPVALLNKRAGFTETPRYVHNQGGGSFGGPLKKDRTFFFGLFEVNRRREAPDARNSTSANIPTPAGYAALQTVPLGTGQPAESRQAVLDALNFLPGIHGQVRNYTNLSNVNINGVPVQVGTINIPLANPYNFSYTQGRVDHRLTKKDSLSYRLQLDKRDEPNVQSNLRFGPLWAGSQTIFGQNHAVSHIRSFNARLFNEFRFAYIRRNLNFPENDPVSPTTNVGSDFVIGGLSNFPQARISNTFQFQNVATYLKGRHSFKMGLDVRRNQLFNLSAFDSKGTWTFNSLADFLNNRAFSLAQAVNEATFDARQTNQFYFFQDDIKVTKNFTLNLGVRYEYSDVPFGFFGAASPEVAAVGVPLPVRADKNNWAPRLGFAYSPGGGQTVIRGGFGMGYDVLFYNILAANASNYPRVVTSLTNQPATNNLFPTLAPKETTVPPLNPLATFVNSPTDTQNPTTHFWSLSVQRQFKTNYIFEVAYTGNRSYHQIRQGQGNPGILTAAQAQTVIAGGSIASLQDRRVNPAWGNRVLIESTALGEYHGMFVRLDKKFSRGLVFGANYTWSANLSDNDESLGVTDIVLSSPQVPQNYFDYRNEWSRSVFDRPHRFVIHYSYEIPWITSGPSALRHVFGGWRMSGFTEYQSGQPFTIRTNVDSGGSGTTAPWRPNYNASGTFANDPVEGNLRTFSTPINGTGIVMSPLTSGGLPLANSMAGGGNLGRNTFRGPGLANWNFSLAKTISLSERLKLQFRSDFIDLWNHRNFQNPEARMNNSAFGSNTAALVSGVGGRTMLLGAKIRF